MHAITVPARASPVAKEIADRAASRITSGLRRMIRRRMNQPRGRSCATSFGPAIRALASASAWVRPSGAVCRQPARTCPKAPEFRPGQRPPGRLSRLVSRLQNSYRVLSSRFRTSTVISSLSVIAWCGIWSRFARAKFFGYRDVFTDRISGTEIISSRESKSCSVLLTRKCMRVQGPASLAYRTVTCPSS
jgi:hypothetical protein